MPSSGVARLLGKCLAPTLGAAQARAFPGALEGLAAAGFRAQSSWPSAHLGLDEDSKNKGSASSLSQATTPVRLGLPGWTQSRMLPLACSPIASSAVQSASLHTPSSSHSFSTLGARQPMGLLSTLPPRPPRTSSAPVRTYLTEGQLWGSAFHLTTDLMFWTGLLGPLFFRRNLIVMLLCTELVMLACNMNFLFASAYFNDMSGVIMSITITTIAACETAIGLALCVVYFHLRSAVDIEALNLLK